jgi:hypothetical protein
MHQGIEQLTLGVTYGQNPEDFRDSVFRIYGKKGHRKFMEEYDTMLALDADIRRT